MENVTLVHFMYFILACQVRVTIGDSSLCVTALNSVMGAIREIIQLHSSTVTFSVSF